MAANITTAQAEAEVREFAAAFPTPNVRRLVALCESGRIGWHDAYAVAHKAMVDGLRATAAMR